MLLKIHIEISQKITFDFLLIHFHYQGSKNAPNLYFLQLQLDTSLVAIHATQVALTYTNTYLANTG